MRKTIRLLCLLLTLILLPALAVADARMPARRGAVTDDADVLSAATASDMAEYAKRVEEETDIRLHTVIVHFLDGLDAQTYADALFEKWELGEKDMLLLAAAGEDSAATAMGKTVRDKLGAANAENLLYTSSDFTALLRTQRYDEAFAAYYTALDTLLEKQTGEHLLGTLFGAQPAPQTQENDFASELWGDVMQAIQNSSASYQTHTRKESDKDNGITAIGWIVLVILAAQLLHKRKHSYRRRGCGCSPLSWIFGLFGLNFLVDFFDKD